MVVRLGADQALGHDPGARAAGPRPRPGPRPSAARRRRRRRSARRCRPCACRRRSTGFSPASPSAVVSRSPWSRVTLRVSPVRFAVLVEHGRLDRRRPRGRSGPRPSRAGLALGRQPERVELLAGDAAPLGDPLGGEELVGHVDVPGRRAACRRRSRRRWRRAGPGSWPRRRRRCRRRSRRRRSGRRPGGWPAGPNRTGSRRSCAAALPGQPGVSQAVRVTLLDCSPAWVTQPPTTCSTSCRVDAGPLDDLALGRAQHLGGVQAGQPAVALADRRACRLTITGVPMSQK